MLSSLSLSVLSLLRCDLMENEDVLSASLRIIVECATRNRKGLM